MIPLWITTMSPVQSACGCALRSFGRPWVAQRVCASPTPDDGASSPIAARRLASLPAFFSTKIDPSARTRAMPAES